MTTETRPGFRARFNGTCYFCAGDILPGDPITWDRSRSARTTDGKRSYYHGSCMDLHRGGSTRGTGYHYDREHETTTRDETETETETEVTSEAETHETTTKTDAATTHALGIVQADVNALAGRVSTVEEGLRHKVSAASCADLIDAQLAKLVVPRTTTVKIETAEYETTIERAHCDFASILQLVQLGRAVGFSVYLDGEPGGGKSTIAQQVAQALGLDFYLCTLAPMSPPSALIGYGTADGTQVESDAFKAYTRGGLLVVEEVDNANDGVLTSFNAALANGKGSWPVIGTVEKHPDFVLIAAGNTPGLGPTRAFPSRRRLDAAFRDRFVFRHVGYDLDLESTLALEVNSDAAEWVRWCRKLREWTRENAPEVFVTPRSVVFGAAMLTLDGTSREDAARACIFRGVESDLQANALRACQV